MFRQDRSAVSGDATRLSVRAQLDAFLAREGVTAALRQQAATLVARLDIGARVVVLGPRGAGKSHVCDALLGVPARSAAPRSHRVFCLGDTARQAPAALGGLEEANYHALPVQRFGRVQIIDMQMPSDDAEAHALTCGLLADADIVLWCTEAFSAEEATLWAQAPDVLKDHSFLVLTKADRLAADGTLGTRLTALRAIAAEEFHSLFPTSTERLVAEARSGLRVSDALFAASGVKALSDALAQLTAEGQQADLDSALLFLDRFASQDAVNNEPHARVGARQASGSGRGRLYSYAEARDRIMHRAIDLAETAFDAEGADMSEVLETCSLISDDLLGILTSGKMNRAEDKLWCAALEQATDKVMLMTLENDLRSAADAATILLQLRRDLAFMAAQ